MNPILTLVVPCYNEEKNIPLLLERFGAAMTRKDVELILVDNGSTDGTRKVMGKTLPRYPFARVVTVEKNTGYGNGVIAGLREGKGEFLAWTHADMQTDPMDALRALDVALSVKMPKDCFIKGERRQRRFFDVFFTRCMTIFVCFILLRWLHEINAQPNLFHRSFMNCMKNPPMDFSFDLYVFYTAKKNGLKVIRFPVEFPERIHGHSHWNTGFMSKIKLIERTISFTIQLRRRIGAE